MTTWIKNKNSPFIIGLVLVKWSNGLLDYWTTGQLNYWAI